MSEWKKVQAWGAWERRVGFVKLEAWSADDDPRGFWMVTAYGYALDGGHVDGRAMRAASIGKAKLAAEKLTRKALTAALADLDSPQHGTTGGER